MTKEEAAAIWQGKASDLRADVTEDLRIAAEGKLSFLSHFSKPSAKISQQKKEAWAKLAAANLLEAMGER